MAEQAPSSSGRSSSRSNRNKRQYISSSTSSSNPRRGAPGIVFTCEQGLERKCARDAIELLQRDWEVAVETTTTTTSVKACTLEEEVEQLKRKNFRVFEQFETRCRGLVIYLCVGCQHVVEPTVSRVADDDEDATCEVPKAEKKPRIAADAETVKKESDPIKPEDGLPLAEKPVVWDPIVVVDRIFRELRKEESTYPSSRFISRMIPLQATLYPDLSQIQHVVQSILQLPSYPKAKKTFAIRTKRRLFDKIERKDLIESLAETVAKERPQWTVKLTEPDFVVQLEINQTLAGVSICSSQQASVSMIAKLKSG